MELVSAHFSMITRVEGSTYTDEPLAFLLRTPASPRPSPYYMGRIVDFPQFIAAYPSSPTRWTGAGPSPSPTPCCPGTRELLADHLPGRAGAVPIPGPCPDRVSIQTMTTMLMGQTAGLPGPRSAACPPARPPSTC